MVIAGNKRIAGSLAGMDLTRIPMLDSALQSPQEREAASTIPVYGQFPFVPNHADGCDIITTDGRHILDLYGGHAVAALGYGHPRLMQAIQEQTYVRNAELRGLLVKELGAMRSALAESRERKGGAFGDKLERFGWLYLFAGILAGGVGSLAAYAPTLLSDMAVSTRIAATLGFAGFLGAVLGAALVVYRRIRSF